MLVFIRHVWALLMGFECFVHLLSSVVVFYDIMTLNFGPFSKHTCQLTLLVWPHMQAREKSRTLMPPALGSVSHFDVQGAPFDVSSCCGSGSGLVAGAPSIKRYGWDWMGSPTDHSRP